MESCRSAIIIRNFLILFFLLPCIEALSAKGHSGIHEVQRVILDTDIDSDVDDAGALAMILNMHKKGIINLLGIITTSDDPFAPVCVSSICTYYGCKEIPVGFLKGQAVLTNHSKYTKFISLEFPSEIPSWDKAEESTSLYRRLLFNSPDESVIILTIGQLSSLKKLLDSAPDGITQLTGLKLTDYKVKKWICMGGQYPTGREANFSRPDPQSNLFCLQHWDKEVFFCGWEAGEKIITGGVSLKTSLRPDNPVYRAYELYNNFAGRSSWDQTAILQLTDKAETFFTFSTPGSCVVDKSGKNVWKNDMSGKQKYIIINPSANIKEIESYIESWITGSRAGF